MVPEATASILRCRRGWIGVLTDQIQQLFNHLIQVELNSAYLYLAMSTYFLRMNLPGMATWLRLQHDEERGHAQQLMNYVVDRGGTVEVRAIPAQPVNFGSPLEAWQQVLKHEQYVTQNYQQAYDMVSKAQDYQSLPIIQDFLREQIDEVAQATVIVGQLQMARDNSAAILLLDRELGQRNGAAAPAGAAPAPAPAPAPAG
ncbi:MAG TPA: ferritin [Symbiobacteriaceae bacterium]|nr:ferritin [Symbiobacteriaceae bacterium]